MSTSVFPSAIDNDANLGRVINTDALVPGLHNSHTDALEAIEGFLATFANGARTDGEVLSALASDPSGYVWAAGGGGGGGGLLLQSIVEVLAVDWDPVVTAAVYTAVPNMAAVSITIGAASRLRVALAGGIRAQDSVPLGFGVKVGGTVLFLCSAQADVHVALSGFAYFVGLGAGTFSVQLVYIGGAGDSIRPVTQGDYEGLSIEVQELAS